MTDAERFEAIYREYQPKVSGYIRSRVSNKEDAEDLCGEVFRKALEHFDSGAGEGMSSYIYTVTRNTVIDYFRTRRVSAPLSEEIPAEETPERIALDRDSLDRLAAALQKLPERERDILVWHYYAEKTLQEISFQLGEPYSVVKRAHQAALKKLRDLMGGE